MKGKKLYTEALSPLIEEAAKKLCELSEQQAQREYGPGPQTLLTIHMDAQALSFIFSDSDESNKRVYKIYKRHDTIADRNKAVDEAQKMLPEGKRDPKTTVASAPLKLPVKEI